MTGHLLHVARCPRHIQPVFNLIVDMHPYGHPCCGQLTAVKKVSTDQYPMTVYIAGPSVQLIEVTCFFKLSTDQLFFINQRLRSIMINRGISLIKVPFTENKWK